MIRVVVSPGIGVPVVIPVLSAMLIESVVRG